MIESKMYCDKCGKYIPETEAIKYGHALQKLCGATIRYECWNTKIEKELHLCFYCQGEIEEFLKDFINSGGAI